MDEEESNTLTHYWGGTVTGLLDPASDRAVKTAEKNGRLSDVDKIALQRDPKIAADIESGKLETGVESVAQVIEEIKQAEEKQKTEQLKEKKKREEQDKELARVFDAVIAASMGGVIFSDSLELSTVPSQILPRTKAVTNRINNAFAAVLRANAQNN